MIYFNPELFSKALPFIAMYMDEKALLEFSSISIASNKCLSSNSIWDKHLYTVFCKEGLEEGDAKLHYFKHMQIYRSFFEKALKTELPKNIIVVRDLVERNLKKRIGKRSSQLGDFFCAEFDQHGKSTNAMDKAICDQNMQMLLKEGARVKTLKRPNFLERSLINDCSFKTIEMLFERGEKCRAVYIYDAIVSRSGRKSLLFHEEEPQLFLANRIVTITSKNQFRFCQILQVKVPAPVAECLAAKVSNVCADTLVCAMQNKHSSRTIEILYGNFQSDNKEDHKHPIETVLYDKWYSEKTVKMFLKGAPEIEERHMHNGISDVLADDILGMIIEKVNPNVQTDPLESTIKKGYSDEIVRQVLAKFKRNNFISQDLLQTALESRYPNDIIKSLIDNLDPCDWIKLEVIKIAEERGAAQEIIERLKNWQSNTSNCF